jgi:hypothetical protein
VIVADCAAVVDALTGLPGTDDLRVTLAEEDLHDPPWWMARSSPRSADSSEEVT